MTHGTEQNGKRVLQDTQAGGEAERRVDSCREHPRAADLTGNLGFCLQAGRKERKEPHKQQQNNGIIFGTVVLCGLRKSDALRYEQTEQQALQPLTCSQYGQGLRQCSAHYIRYDYLYHYVLLRVQDLWRQSQVNEQAFLHRLLKASAQELAANAKRQSTELTRAEKRRTEVDRKFAKLYEDWSDGRITEYNFNMMSQKYQTEQQELTEKIERLSAELESDKQTTVDAETWISLLKQYATPTELTAELLNTLIEKIVVHEATTVDGMREQNIDIYYRFIGKIE